MLILDNPEMGHVKCVKFTNLQRERYQLPLLFLDLSVLVPQSLLLPAECPKNPGILFSWNLSPDSCGKKQQKARIAHWNWGDNKPAYSSHLSRKYFHLCYLHKGSNIHKSHFSYSCKMRYLLNLVLENWVYLWFY